LPADYCPAGFGFSCAPPGFCCPSGDDFSDSTGPGLFGPLCFPMNLSLVYTFA